MKRAKHRDSFVSERVAIGRTLHSLRLERAFTQAEVAADLQLSQAQLSRVEAGTSSLTAEQLLRALQLFNSSVERFTASTVSRDAELQNALVRAGATHLRTIPNAPSTSRYERFQDLLAEVLESGDPRWITALGPILATHASELNLNRLTRDRGFTGLTDRLFWLFENVLEASKLARVDQRSPSSRALRTLIEFATPPSGTAEDVLDPAIRSRKTADQVRRDSSNISKRWHIVTRLQPDDFASVLNTHADG